MSLNLIPYTFLKGRKQDLAEKDIFEIIERDIFKPMMNKADNMHLLSYGSKVFLVVVDVKERRISFKLLSDYQTDDSGSVTSYTTSSDIKDTYYWKTTTLSLFFKANAHVFNKKKNFTTYKRVEDDGLPVFLNRYSRIVSGNGLSKEQYYYTITTTNSSARLKRDFNNLLATKKHNDKYLEYSKYLSDFTKVVDEVPLEVVDKLNKWIELEFE